VLVLVLVEVYQKIAKPRPITVDILDSAGNILGQLVSGPRRAERALRVQTKGWH
jgi:hypothetical protein